MGLTDPTFMSADAQSAKVVEQAYQSRVSCRS